MKSAILFLFPFSSAFMSKGQTYIPACQAYSTTAIANYITTNYKTESKRLLAAYTWVTANIKYDTDSMYAINNDKYPETKITAALRRRKGVCENFVAIFNDILTKSGVRCYEINGYTRQFGTIDKTGHTWSAVFTNGQWLFCDPTWDAGFYMNPTYFLITPDEFIGSHMPFDPLWQLLEYPVSDKEFYSGNFYTKKEKPYINFSDSVNIFLKLDEKQQLASTAARIEQSGIPNELVRTRLVYVNMKLNFIEQDKIMEIYNATVLDFNHSNNLLNDFIAYRNEKFIPVKNDIEINKMLLPIDDIIAVAYKKISVLENMQDNFQYDPGILKNRLDALSGRLKEQKEFLKKYFETRPLERGKLFYK